VLKVWEVPAQPGYLPRKRGGSVNPAIVLTCAGLATAGVVSFFPMPRWLARFWAWATSTFWIECPRCSRYFGGFECNSESDMYSVRCSADNQCRHGTCCKRNVAVPDDVVVCSRWHKMRSKETP
jgi:hypothetical protein